MVLEDTNETNDGCVNDDLISWRNAFGKKFSNGVSRIDGNRHRKTLNVLNAN